MKMIIIIATFICGIVALLLGERITGMLFMIMAQLSIIIDKLEKK